MWVGGEGGWQGGFVYASYREKGRQGGEGVQNPELSCVNTSSKTLMLTFVNMNHKEAI